MSHADQQRVTDHYDATIDTYEALHGEEQDRQHTEALEGWWRLVGPHVPIESILDVGCGTGRALAWFASRDSRLRLTGIDPSGAMCDRALERVPRADVRQASGDSLPFADRSFDLVVATGIMHHVPRPKIVIREMFRVAERAVLISDHNDFAMGASLMRHMRASLYAAGLLDAYSYIRQGFRRQRFSEEDGWYYPYSLLRDYGCVSALSREVLVFPTSIRGAARTEGFVTRQSHLAYFCTK